MRKSDFEDMSKFNSHSIIVRLDYNAVLTVSGGEITLEFPIYDAVAMRAKYFSVTRLAGAVDDGAIQVLHCNLAGNAKQTSFRMAYSTDLIAANAVQTSEIIGYAIDMSRQNEKTNYLNFENPIIEFSSPTTVKKFSFYISDAQLVPLTYPTPFIVELVLEIFTKSI